MNTPFAESITVVPGFRVLGFSVLPGFRALKASDGPWSVHKTLFGFRAPLPQLYICIKLQGFFLLKRLDYWIDGFGILIVKKAFLAGFGCF